MAWQWYQIKQEEDGLWSIYITKNPGDPMWQFATREQAERQVEETNAFIRGMDSIEGKLKAMIPAIMEEHKIDRKEAFKWIETALGHLAIKEGRTITIIGTRAARGEDEGEDSDPFDGAQDRPYGY
jgi:hypothetical protein